ncbi:serine/threonine protein kinase [Frankia sp. EI5c]|uniref:serine/threonine-protein kinase n=1 Tax=Frankia sp. EI5c TaxID=683316 RepID=UPI0007C396CB|nr:serine/threonine-protein kinase [Frankia sp. EI5c]OAA27875.1 serine/threonine protein kinase [Frankia sp. EI5c]
MADGGQTPLRATDPRFIGPHALEQVLGSGGMGRVYLGRSPDGRRVAVKVIHDHLARDGQYLARFEREARIARGVAPFCTAEVLDFGLFDGRPYIVTEFLEGPTLAEAVSGQGPLATTDLHQLAVSIAAALTSIHSAGLVHRDIKPANVLLSKTGPRVIDFGVAMSIESDSLLTNASDTIGTPAFMAPEQASREITSASADVFAWGGVVAFAGTGRPPFGLGAAPVVMYRVVHEEPDLAGLDSRLLPLVRAAMSKSPAARPTAAELLAELTGSTRPGLVVAPLPAPAAQTTPSTTAGTAGAATAGPGGTAGSGPDGRAPEPPPSASPRQPPPPHLSQTVTGFSPPAGHSQHPQHPQHPQHSQPAPAEAFPPAASAPTDAAATAVAAPTPPSDRPPPPDGPSPSTSPSPSDGPPPSDVWAAAKAGTPADAASADVPAGAGTSTGTRRPADGPGSRPDQPPRTTGTARAGRSGRAERSERRRGRRRRMLGAMTAALVALGVAGGALLLVGNPLDSAGRETAVARSTGGAVIEAAGPADQTTAATPGALTTDTSAPTGTATATAPATDPPPAGAAEAATAGPAGPSASPEPPGGQTDPRYWTEVLQALDRARVAAFETGDVRLLAQVYTAVSSARAADEDAIRAMVMIGGHGQGGEQVFENVEVVTGNASFAVLHFTSHLKPFSILDANGRVISRNPATAPTLREVNLVRTVDGWRASQVTEV